MKTPLNLKGLWKVALVDIKIDIDPLLGQKDVCLYCDVCGESIVDGNVYPLLPRICLMSSDSGYYTFEHLCYIDVIKCDA